MTETKQKFLFHIYLITAKSQDLVPFQVLLSFHIATCTLLCIWTHKLLFLV